MPAQRSETTSLENEVILPEQYWESRAVPRGGELALLWMVLMDGIRDYQTAIERGATRGPDFRETEQWILGRGGPHVTSFRNLCEIFGIDATRLRRKLLAMREAAERPR